MMIEWKYDDGGRKSAGFKGSAGDCVVRSIAIATGESYKTVYDDLAIGNQNQRRSKRESENKARTGKRTARHGIFTRRKWFKDYMKCHGFRWVSTMGIGTGCQVHLRKNELPNGTIIVRLSRHYAAVIDGVLHDTHDCSRNGTRCVYGYWEKIDPFQKPQIGSPGPFLLEKMLNGMFN